jgi:hypothetical protein
MSERGADRLLYEALEDEAARKHGEHILEAVAAQEDRRQGRAEDPLLELLRQVHQARPGDDGA